ncbi:ABC transporter ATP-binding protein [Marinifilum caeruleilacunae]|uniref:ABC transporter ATP-binding protein n=1 Tax=Marinifilum caeruleilacunae TaxID=2499076 RepID=A0ABX1WRY9_9BACT|nr:ATP-binding cassette domain-containing protein [Marinifilum caeruleilacunae]NOU58688.1 ABC transporter ATP-binding protein [Marinifilum caeruleilacunae]
MIKFENVSLRFGELVICENLSFDLDQGGSLCLSGPSGKGKSSLLKLILGIIKPDSGKIFIDGKELNATNIFDARKKIVWLPQNIHLPVNSGKELTELLDFQSENLELYHHYLDQLGIASNGKEKLFTEVSGGQKQRMVMAACLSLDKPILLLDEPVSALDDDSIDQFIHVINGLKGKTIVSTSHNKRWIEQCSSIIKL